MSAVVLDAKPFVTRPGGKSDLVGVLMAVVDKMAAPPVNYFEPFVGGGALFWAMCQERRIGSKAYLSDLDPALMNAYGCVRESAGKVHAALTALGAHDGNWRDVYGASKYRFNKGGYKSQWEWAADTIYLSKCAWRGVWRVNGSGGFNVTHRDQERMPGLPELHELEACSKFLNAKTNHASGLRRCSYHHVTLRAKPGDLVYLDPPYDQMFDQYTKSKFTEQHHAELAADVTRLSNAGVEFIMTNSDTPLIRDLYRHFTRKAVTYKRGHAVDSKGSGLVKDLLITNICD